MRQNLKKNQQKLRPNGSMDAILGGGLAECAGRAEALELGILGLLFSTLCPAEGAADLNASRIPPGQEENVGPRVEMAVGDRIIRDGGSEVVAVVGEGWGLVRAG